MGKIAYIAYGANRSSKRLKEILGKEPEGGQDVILTGFELKTQNLSQIPISAALVLERVWGKSFKSYTLKESFEGKVAAKVWYLDEGDYEKLKEWEFVGDWREVVPAKAMTYDGKTVFGYTEKAYNSQPVEDGFVDGEHYENNINWHLKMKKEPADDFKIPELKEAYREVRGLSLA